MYSAETFPSHCKKSPPPSSSSFANSRYLIFLTILGPKRQDMFWGRLRIMLGHASAHTVKRSRHPQLSPAVFERWPCHNFAAPDQQPWLWSLLPSKTRNVESCLQCFCWRSYKSSFSIFWRRIRLQHTTVLDLLCSSGLTAEDRSRGSKELV